MSAEYKLVARVRVVTDHDCGNYEVGEVDGSFDTPALYDHIKEYGSAGLLKQLAFMTSQVIQVEVAEHKDSQDLKGYQKSPN